MSAKRKRPTAPQPKRQKKTRVKQVFTTWRIAERRSGPFGLEGAELHYLGYRKPQEMRGDTEGKRGKLLCVLEIHKLTRLHGHPRPRYRFETMLLEDLSGKYGLNLKEWAEARGGIDVRETPVTFIIAPTGERHTVETMRELGVPNPEALLPPGARYIPGGEFKVLSPDNSGFDEELRGRFTELFWFFLERIPIWEDHEAAMERLRAEARRECAALEEQLTESRRALSAVLEERGEAGKKLARAEHALRDAKRGHEPRDRVAALQSEFSQQQEALAQIREKERLSRAAISELEAKLNEKRALLNPVPLNAASL